ncbi:putative MFS transporter, partial [Trypanosoma grayi]|uniref:putative MFS transporter n=1 Tax=Trypanosoma grayi TaxID=71804 RepID=UPI0004F4325F
MSLIQELQQRHMRGSRDARQWVVLLLFCLFSSSNAIQWITFAPIATPAREFFGMSTDQLNYLSSVYMIIFAGGVIFTCTTFERWGVRRGVLIGSGLNALGSVLKVAPGLFYPSFTTMIIPQTINSIAQLFVLSTPPLIAAHYFPPHRRAFATAVATTSNSLGNAIALFVPPFVVQTADRRSFTILFGVEMAYCCSVFLGVIFFLKPPRHPPRRGSQNYDSAQCSATERGESRVGSKGASASSRGRTRQPHQHEDRANDSISAQDGRPSWEQNEHIRGMIHVAHTGYLLLKSRDFLFLFFAFSISMGSVWTFASVLTQILEPFGVEQELAGVMGAVNIVAGTGCAYAVGAWVGQSRQYKLTLLLCLLFSAACCSGLILTMVWAPPNTKLMSGVCSFVYILAGLGQNTAIPICFEFSMEITHPLPESVPGALLMAGANVASLILLSVSSALLGEGLATP